MSSFTENVDKVQDVYSELCDIITSDVMHVCVIG